MSTSNWLTVAAILLPLGWQNWREARRTRRHQDEATSKRLGRLEVAVRRIREQLDAHRRDPRGHATLPPAPRSRAGEAAP